MLETRATKRLRIYLIVVDHADEGFIILRKALKDLGVAPEANSINTQRKEVLPTPFVNA